MKPEEHSSYDVWRWPEFKAFAKRLGLDQENLITDFSIHFPLDGSVSIDETYLASDRLTRDPLDTTTVHNETRRTKVPSNPRTPVAAQPQEAV